MKAERRGFIFARVGVRIAGHWRFLRIPAAKRAAALGVWTAALTFTREEQLDGFCPLEAIQTIAAKDIVDRLVEVGLFTRENQDGVQGVMVLKYDDFNDTKAEIDAAREKERVRKSDARSGGRPAGVPLGVPRVVLPDNRRESSGSPSSSSSSLSRSGSPRSDHLPHTVIQNGKAEPSSGTVRVGDFPRSEPETEIEKARAKALDDAARLAADPSFAAGGKP